VARKFQKEEWFVLNAILKKIKIKIKMNRKESKRFAKKTKKGVIDVERY
jgi:hypothetical protein